MSSRQSMKKRMQQNADENQYYLCPDKELLDSLLDGLVANQQRYGYASCPCRIGSGRKAADIDIICPCEYRDADINEFGMCYCGLFVNEKIKADPDSMGPIPERRPVEIIEQAMSPTEKDETKPQQQKSQTKSPSLSSELPVYRCTVCGYLCAREYPPPICPICKAKKEKFEQFSVG